MFPTGAEGQRDGSTVRVALQGYAAPAPVLDVRVGPAAAHDGLPETAVPDLTVASVDADINGLRLRQVTYRWKSNGEIAFVELRGPNVILQFQAGAGLVEVRDTIWWHIMSSFRLR